MNLINIFENNFINKCFFVEIYTTTKYPNLSSFKEKDKNMYDIWTKSAYSRYGEINDEIYHKKGVFLGENNQISGIGVAYFNDETKNFEFEYYTNNEEVVNILIFLNTQQKNNLKQIQSNSKQILCGYNIQLRIMPNIIKKVLIYRNLVKKQYGVLLNDTIKKYLISKPWEGSVLDVLNVWKFGGGEYTTMETIASYLNFKFYEPKFFIQPEDQSEIYWSYMENNDIVGKNEFLKNYLECQLKSYINLLTIITN